MNRPPVKNDQLRSKFNLAIDEKKKKISLIIKRKR